MVVGNPVSSEKKDGGKDMREDEGRREREREEGEGGEGMRDKGRDQSVSQSHLAASRSSHELISGAEDGG